MHTIYTKGLKSSWKKRTLLVNWDLGSSISNVAINFWCPQGSLLKFDTIRLILKAYLWTYLNNNDQVLMLEIMKLFNNVCMPGVYRYKCGKVPRVTVTFWRPRYHVTIFLTANCSKIDQWLHKCLSSNYIDMGKLKIKLIPKLILLF